MGTVFSSKRDFNRVLATQPRRSIIMPRFEQPNTTHQERPSNPFTIPAPMRISQPKSPNENTTRSLPNEPHAVNEGFLTTQTPRQPEPRNLLPLINSQIQKKPENNQAQQQMNAPHSVRSDAPVYHQKLNGDAVILSRSVINRNEQHHLINHRLSSVQPRRTIVEHNGKKFLVELRERTERRYVQYRDETTHKMRFFEVIDYIPCRIIQPYKHTSQSLPKDDTSYNSTLRSSQHSVPSLLLNKQLETTAPSNSINPRSLRFSTISLPSKSPSPLQLTTRSITDSMDYQSQHLQPNSLNYSSFKPRNIFDQYSSEPSIVQPPPFRAHTPTNSDYSVTSSETDSSDSGEETETEDNKDNDRMQRSNKNGSAHELLDPFARSENPMEHHHYRKRPDIDKYTEPMMNNRRFPRPDYAPIPVMTKQPHQNPDSRRNDSSKTVSFI